MCRQLIRSLILFLFFTVVTEAAVSQHGKILKEHVVLQLHWIYDYSFAGFIMAKEKGFYDDVGLDVELREYKTGMDVEKEVLEGRANYGIYNSQILLDYLEGKPLKLLGSFFKRAALVLVTQPNIHSIADLRDKTIMAGTKKDFIINFRPFFEKYHIGMDEVKIVPHPYRIKEFAEKNKIAAVIGTTGLNNDEKDKIRKAASTIPVVQSPNMSVGVNTLFKITEITARILGDDYDVEIVEAHHRFKKDAPSGTAVRLGEIVAETLGRKYPEDAIFERKGIIGERSDKEIGMQTLRAGDIVGEHTVMFGGIGERIELTHRAHNRENFARGALKAAKWVKSQNPGYYDMQDVLGFKNI